MLNANLFIAGFYKLRKSGQGGFAKWRMETLPKGVRLFKQTKGDAPEPDRVVERRPRFLRHLHASTEME